MNREKYNEYHKKYLRTWRVEKEVLTNCFCGGRYLYSNKTRHLKSKGHQNYLISHNINGNEISTCQEIQ